MCARKCILDYIPVSIGSQGSKLYRRIKLRCEINHCFNSNNNSNEFNIMDFYSLMLTLWILNCSNDNNEYDVINEGKIDISTVDTFFKLLGLLSLTNVSDTIVLNNSKQDIIT
eukprot:316583_1